MRSFEIEYNNIKLIFFFLILLLVSSVSYFKQSLFLIPLLVSYLKIKKYNY